MLLRVGVLQTIRRKAEIVAGRYTINQYTSTRTSTAAIVRGDSKKKRVERDMQKNMRA